MYYEVEKVFNRILDREMKILITEKEKQIQQGRILDEATDKIIEAYFLKSEYNEMKKLKDYYEDGMKYQKEEKERYEKLYMNNKNKKGDY